MTVVYGPGVRMKFSTTRRPSTVRDLSIRDGRTGWGVHGVGVNCMNHIMCTWSPHCDIQCPNDQIWSCFAPGMAPSANLSPGDLYIAFGCADLKSGCDPTENVPSWSDRVWYIIWCSVVACVIHDAIISHMVYPEICVNLHIEIPTTLGHGSASEISHP